MSYFKTLPLLPVPMTCFKSTLCYLAHILTVADAKKSYWIKDGWIIGWNFGCWTVSTESTFIPA